MADKKMYKVGITVKEPWSADISYEVLDITLYAVESGGDGCSYTAIKPNQGVTPGTDSTVWVKSTQAGQSIYDLAVKYHHFVGTEEEFEAEYEAAVHAAQSAAQSASDIEAQVETNEAARVAAERARSDAETARSSAETARINAENARNDAESLRDTAESDRVRAESGRVTAEASRVEAETFRQGAEQSRRQQFEGLKTDMETAIDNVDAKSAEIAEDIEGYEANEAGRVSAENARAAAESARASAEQGRATAETARQTAEGNRATAETERASAEGARTTAEQGRVSAEQGRVNAESGRVSAESDRVSAETARESASATAVQNAETATAAANTAAEHAEEAATTIDDKIAGKADESEVSQLRSEIGKNTIEINPVWESGKYYTTNNIGSVPTQGTAASWTCAVFPVKKDEKYTITGRGGDSPRLWATADDDGKVLKYCSTGSSSVSITDYITIVEDGYLYVNMNYKGAGDGIWRTIGGQQAQIVLLQEKTDVTDIKLEKVARAVGLYEYSFEANSVEHPSLLDKYAISYNAGGEIRGRLSQGTAICDGTNISVNLYDSNNVIKASKPITIGTDFDISANVDCAYISFYIYRVTKTGTFLVSLEYLTLADAREEIEELKDDIKETKKMIDGEDSFSFTSATGEHSSTLDKHPINYSAGGIIRGTLSQGTGVCDGTSVSVNLYDSENTLVARKDITIGTEFIISAPNDASYISFYLYRVSVAGTFLVALNYGGVEERVENIEERFDSEFEQVPYYYDAMLATKKVSIRSAMLDAGKNGSTFVFITDVHWSNNEKHSPALIGFLLRNLPIENVFYGGDTFNGGAVETQVGYLEDFGKRMHNVASRFFPIFGNHDANYNDGGEGFDGDYFYTMLMKYADYQVVSGNYDNYYFDNPTTKTRFIVLNTGTGGNYYTAEQSSWLSSILSGMGDGYHAIIFLHIAYLTATDLANDTMTPLMASVASVADSFNSLNNGKKVEAFISGHLHDDANKTTTGGIPIILTDCDTKQTSSGNPQTAGTINEQAFDVITIDYSGTITCVRIGRGSDRTITY